MCFIVFVCNVFHNTPRSFQKIKMKYHLVFCVLRFLDKQE